MLCTRTADNRAMRLAVKVGSTEAGRFEEYGAERWFGVRRGPRQRVELEPYAQP